VGRGGEGRGREGRGEGKGKLVPPKNVRDALTPLHDREDELYKCTDLLTYLLTYISSTIGFANFAPGWPLLFKVHEI